MEFHKLATYFDALEQTSGRLDMTHLLAKLFAESSPAEANHIAQFSLGQLNPPYVGTQFNMAEKTIVSVISRLTGADISEVQKEAKKVGDLGILIGQGGWRKKGEGLSVIDVYHALLRIEKISGTGSQEEKEQALIDLLQQLDPLSAKFVVRIIVGKLRLGFSDMTIVDALSWMEAGDKSLRAVIEDAYNVCADIGFIAQVLKRDGIAAIEHMHVQIGIPIRPAAAERLPTARAIIEKIGHCIAQPKLDGFRLQIHLDKTKKKPEVHFFSRNLIDMSYMFPDLAAAVEKLPVKTLICEGEAIVYDQYTGTFLPFQETVKRKRKHGIEQAISEYPLQVYLFDVLYLDGEDLMGESHAQRRKALKELCSHFDSNVVRMIDEVDIRTPEQLEEYFLQNISAGLEGLVVKKIDSIYQPGKRNFNWIKLKRQEEGHLEDTLDCVVLGYYAGEGKRAQFGIGAFLVGVYNPREDRFETVAKIGTGLKDADWIALKKKCDAIAVSAKPKNVVCDKSLAPDVWCTPEIVCMVRADEITLSPVHVAGKAHDKPGYALRFPRFMGYREDKSANEATTPAEVKRLYEDQYAA